MENRKKILIINNGLSLGGIERASSSLANHFSDLDYNVQVLALYQGEVFFKLNNSIKYIEPIFQKKNTGKVVYVFKLFAYVRKETKKFNPDTVLAFSEWTNPYVMLALIGLRYPIYLSDRMSPSVKLPFISEMLKRITYKFSDGIIAQTNFGKKVLYKKTKSEKIVTIPNPINVIQKVDCAKKKKIVSVGRLSKEKGHKYLIEAFAKIKDKSWELSLVGAGSEAKGYTNEKDSLEVLAHKLNVRERVIFHGHLKDFSLQLSESQIFVLPSLTEGFPNALIEAMGFPLPCISSNFIGAPKEIIKHGVNGFLYEPKDVDNLASILNLLIDDPGLRNKIAIEGFKLRETLAFDIIAKRYLDLIVSKND